jgi:hypothetical protein
MFHLYVLLSFSPFVLLSFSYLLIIILSVSPSLISHLHIKTVYPQQFFPLYNIPLVYLTYPCIIAMAGDSLGFIPMT